MLARVATDVVVSTRELAEALVPAAAARSMRLLGHGSPGDMGEAFYLRTSSEPAHPGKFQTADGAWWELSSREVPPEVFGAQGDGFADDSWAFRQAAEWSALTGGVVVGAPGATYRLVSGVSVAGGRFHGRGARIDFRGPARAVIFEFELGAEHVEVLNWRIETSRTSHVAVRCTRVRGARVEGIQLTRGCLFHCYPESGKDASNVTEADLNHDLRIRGNICQGDGAAPDGGANLAVVRLSYVLGAVAEGNDIRGYTGESTQKFSGIVWWGGDSNPSKSGGVGSVRWARNIRIQGNRVSGVSSGGIWGSQGRDITCTGNTVEECGDIGIHGEGSDGIAVTGNTMRNCRNGGFNPYFIEERAVYSSNSVVITDAATWGVTLVKQNMSFTAEAFEIVMANNVLEMLDPSAIGQVTLQRGGCITFEGNVLRNVVVNALNVNCGTRIFRGNHLLFPRDPQTHAITAGRLRHPGSTRSSGLWVENNLIEAWDWTPTSLFAAIYVGHTAASASERPFAVVRGNDIRGWRDVDTGEPRGFLADILTESLDNNSLHVTEILNNRLWAGVVADITDGKVVDSAQLYRQRIKHHGNLSSRFDRITPYDDGPRSGVFMKGSRGLNNAPDVGQSEGWLITGADSSAPSLGPWSSSASYAFPDQVTGSDGAIYIAMRSSGPGAGGAQNPTTADGAVWRRIARAAASVADFGSVSA